MPQTNQVSDESAAPSLRQVAGSDSQGLRRRTSNWSHCVVASEVTEAVQRQDAEQAGSRILQPLCRERGCNVLERDKLPESECGPMPNLPGRVEERVLQGFEEG